MPIPFFPASELLRAFRDFAAGSCHGQRDAVSSVVRHLGERWRKGGAFSSRLAGAASGKAPEGAVGKRSSSPRGNGHHWNGGSRMVPSRGPLCARPARRTESDRPGSTNPKPSHCLEFESPPVAFMSLESRNQERLSSKAAALIRKSVSRTISCPVGPSLFRSLSLSLSALLCSGGEVWAGPTPRAPGTPPPTCCWLGCLYVE